MISDRQTPAPTLMTVFSRAAVAALAALALGAAPAAAAEPTLRGSPSSMVRQHDVAMREDFTFVATPAQVERMTALGRLVPLPGNADYELAKVSYPFARPEVRTFVERLAAQYRAACGERLVVTSLTRPTEEQPGNAHRLSVHPAGMAVDFRVSESGACQEWLEGTLLELEGAGLVDATRERNPPHYHVAVFPERYGAHAARLAAGEARREAAARERADSLAALAVADDAPAGGYEGGFGADAGGDSDLLEGVVLLAVLLAGLGVALAVLVRRGRTEG